MTRVRALGYTGSSLWRYWLKNWSERAAIFPPGATSSGSPRQPSQWREFAFAIHQIQTAIEPKISLIKVLSGWNQIAADLAENHRERELQVRVLIQNLEGKRQ